MAGGVLVGRSVLGEADLGGNVPRDSAVAVDGGDRELDPVSAMEMAAAGLGDVAAVRHGKGR